MLQVKKSASSGMWTVQLVSTAKVIFQSLSRATCRTWADVNSPIPAADQLNASIGVQVWRSRNV